MPQGSLALERRLVKWPRATRTEDRRDGQERRPDVLRRMPLSCSVVFDILRFLAGGEAVEVSLRDLAEMTRYSPRQVRRALRRLEGAHLIRWKTSGPGRGHVSIFEILWRPLPFPQEKGASPTRARDGFENPSEKCVDSFLRKTPACAGGSPSPPRLKGRTRLSPRAERWSIAEFRRRLAKWTPEEIAGLDGDGEDGLATFATGLDYLHVLEIAECKGLQAWADEFGALGGPDRERAMLLAAAELRRAVVDGFAVALHRAIKRGRIRTGRELAQMVERVAEVLNREAQDWLWPWLSERMAIDGERAAYAWIGRLVRVACEAIEEERMAEQVRSWQARAEAEQAQVRAEWKELAASGFSFTEQARRMAEGSGQVKAELNAAVAQLAAKRGRDFEASDSGKLPENRRRAFTVAGIEEHSKPATPMQGERGAGVLGGRTSAPLTWGAFQWRAMPDGSGYWVLGGKPTANRREAAKFSPQAAIELRRLGRQLEIAEAQGDREKAAELLKRIVELRRSLTRR